MNTKSLLSVAVLVSLVSASAFAMEAAPVAPVAKAAAAIVEPINKAAKDACTSNCSHGITEKATKVFASIKVAAANGIATARAEGSKLSTKAVDQYGKFVSFITAPKSWTNKDKAIVAAVVAGVAVSGYAFYKWYTAQPKAKKARK